jgi:hypothetical protein
MVALLEEKLSDLNGADTVAPNPTPTVGRPASPSAAEAQPTVGVNGGTMAFDPTVTIEGAATALGVLGAATGYVINLIRGWHFDYKDKRYAGTNRLILDLLEKNFWTGLTESKLYELYISPELNAKRKEYQA